MHKKRAVIIFTLLLVATSIFILNNRTHRKYITVVNGVTTDATKYVESGEYAYNCSEMILVRKNPLPFPKEKALQFGMSKFDGYEEDAEEVAIMLTGKAYWYDSLHYAYTTITEEYAIIHNHVFQTLTSYKGKQYLVSVFNYVYVKNDPKQFFFSVARYDPKRDIPYEQRLNAAELSCKDRTNSFEEDEE